MAHYNFDVIRTSVAAKSHYNFRVNWSSAATIAPYNFYADWTLAAFLHLAKVGYIFGVKILLAILDFVGWLKSLTPIC